MSETIYTGGPIITLSASHRRPEAILVRDGRIVSVGKLREIESHAGRNAHRYDLAGKVLVPGFNDAHVHLTEMGQRETQINLWGLTKQEILGRLAEEADATADPLVAFGWDYRWCREPHRDDLDRLFPDRPVLLIQFSGHGAWANSAALKTAGITGETPDWGLGGAERDGSGAPTGILREPADHPEVRRLWYSRTYSPERIRAGLSEAMRLLPRFGITSVQDNTWFPKRLVALRQLYQEGALTARVSCWSLGKVPDRDREFTQMPFEPPWYALGPRKFFWDGAFSSRTAWLTEPYADRPETSGSGTEVATIRSHLDQAIGENRQVAAHAIGDAAVAAYVEALESIETREKLQRTFDVTQQRFRIEHGQVIREEDMERIHRLGMVVSAQPHAACDPEKDVQILGARRARRAYPYRTLLDAGVPLAFGSDYPGENTFNPLYGIHLAVNRTGEEAITPLEALESYTAGGAYAEFAEGEKGRIEPGYVADFAVLSQDPTEVAPERVGEIVVEATVLGGRIIYRREDGAGGGQTAH